MKGIGIVRKVDHLGRIVLPKELRDLMSINPHDGVEIFVDNNAIVLKKYNPSCILCGSSYNLFYFRDKIICEECISETAKYVLAKQPQKTVSHK
ncbi:MULTISPECIES: AbrB/MazE/SpoVT family DNA-binding domain-containing protein [Thermoactinomyces]|jgi:AbrB family transcriptional regulator, transcriptional pleiotropic regulator of transition state genes|uniref:AbrB/MazE/SpoVT family DNA-binding domain-containing protein n=1 Tax=Thermoactinomyces daqus TaxID=1329516 RepID=A0A7W1X9Y2_9BACL|nr:MULTISPECIES: AbrB/MazE/SpoVT family DNA-binding domain-containing protein [Thermoactinomyces]MBA4542737.1 AbrB/MazE/SpoVT family DNA-binding domain-containing protein [Thermoactinomyces daqus]MBH8598592.1 AbrB/MazE/SpoVT family DNA-binding domain-containing protein [Thermoactinomyces sp. CICC 10523]MBH8606976.1 AbrB/MazE/SpoVT family DNA-binding domain-containing protein [Thermoactinomyces sp. CICC 10521]